MSFQFGAIRFELSIRTKKLSIVNGLPGSWCMHHVSFLFNLV